MGCTTSVGAVLVAAAVLCSGQVRTNFSLLDSMVARAVSDLPCGGCDSAVVLPYQSAARWLVVEKWIASGKTTTENARCTLAIADCAVRYALHPTERDSVIRTVTVDVRLMTPDTTCRSMSQYADTLAREDIVAVELPRSELTSSPVPPPPRSLWDDLLEPVVIVASVATTLLLLFTARSR
ncbi:MAG: hypothetical protein N3B17_09130 [Chlorobi bacterium]|jgi:hypothetical protein|nr:hypothetical protein [Chlorobiota bacterium]